MGRPSRYPDEFRHEAAQMALASNDSRASVARRLGVNETTLRNWSPTNWPSRPGSDVGILFPSSGRTWMCWSC
jgi:transposase-like protein